jgi:hypothetical protein
MPISEARLHANRINAAKSTGPKTPEGKARSAQNATRHGLLAQQILIGQESPGDLQSLIDTFTEHFAPINAFERHLVEDLAASCWRMRRSWSIEKEMLEAAMSRQSAPTQAARTAGAFGELARHPKLALLHRYETRLHLMYQRALNNLLRLRQLRPPASALPDIPIEPKTPCACNESPGRGSLQHEAQQPVAGGGQDVLAPVRQAPRGSVPGEIVHGVSVAGGDKEEPAILSSAFSPLNPN